MKIQLNGETRKLAPGTTVAGLLDLIQRKPEGVAVAVNLQVVPREKHQERGLKDGDRVDLVTAVGGG